MNSTSNAVSIHPYFQIHPGKLEGVKALLSAFVEKTAAESKNLYYAHPQRPWAFLPGGIRGRGGRSRSVPITRAQTGLSTMTPCY